MARHSFGGGPSDWAFTTAVDNITPNLVPGATITCWNMQSGGTQLTDLTQDSAGTITISSLLTSDGSDGNEPGQVPLFYGPDGVTSLWVSANGGPRLIIACNDLDATVQALASLVDDVGAVQLRGGGNFVPNPSFGDGLTGWTTAANGTLTLDTANGIFGVNCGKVARNHSAGNGPISAISPAAAIKPSITYSVTGWVRLGSLGGLTPRTAQIVTHWYDAGMTSLRDDASNVFTESIQGTWLQLTHAGLLAPDAAAFVEVELVVSGVDADEFHFFDGFQVEPGGMPTSFNSNYAASTLTGAMMVPASVTVRETAPGSAKALAGLAASRPAASTQGLIYFATDTGVVSYDNGSTWTNGVGSAATYTSPNAEPSEQGLAGWVDDPVRMSTASSATVTSGQVTFSRLKLKTAATLTTFLVQCMNVGATVTNAFLALYDSTGTRVAVSADISGSLVTTSVMSVAMVSSYAAAAGTYYVAFLVGGFVTTAPAFAVMSANGMAAINAGIGSAPFRFGSYTIGSQTSMPSSFNPSTQMSVNNKPYWAAVK